MGVVEVQDTPQEVVVDTGNLPGDLPARECEILARESRRRCFFLSRISNFNPSP